MTNTPTKVLTTAELARHLGRPARAEVDLGSLMEDGPLWTEKDAVINTYVLHGIAKGTIRNVRPILRRLADMTPEDAKEVMRLAFGLDFDEVKITTVITSTILLAKGFYLQLTPDGKMMGYSIDSGKETPQTFNATAVGDYLDAKGYDRRGYLAANLAIPAQP